jgi:Cu2+-exporting ATPase
LHCGEPVVAAAPLLATVNGCAHAVCCIGCRAAAEWIATLGLQDYYRLRDGVAARADARADYAAWDRAQLQKLYVHARADGSAEVSVLVEGLRCAACSWLIERALAGVDGVLETNVNVIGKRVAIAWDPRRASLSRLLDAIARLGYAPHPLDPRTLDDVAAREQRGALKRLVVAALGMMQAMMFAIVLYTGASDGIDAATRDFFRWLGLIVTIPVVFYAARPFFAGALRELRARRPGMDTPVALAVALVFAASVLETLRGGSQVYFDSASMFVFLLLGGRYLEMRARHRASAVVDALARLQPATAQRRRADDTLETVGVHELEGGDRVVVASGATVPADGELLSDLCRVDEALLSGESRPLQRGRGDTLVAGSVVVDGPAELRVERIGAETRLAAIVRLVGRAQQQRAAWSRYGDRVAGVFVVALIGAAAATAAFWLMFDPGRAFAATLAVLVVACPCAFALAVPAGLARTLAVLAERGILVLTPNAVDALVRADHFVFDKTGTLGERSLVLQAVHAQGGVPAAECVGLAAGLETGNTHPVAQALRAAAVATLGTRATNLRAVAGCGVEGDIEGRHSRLGRAGFPGDADASAVDDVVLCGPDGVLARFELGERPRADAAATIAALRADGAGVEILIGDSAARATAFAARVGVAEVHARMTPEGKLERLAALRAAGCNVAVVGDGVNDAPALAGADLAVAIGGGTDLARANADIVLSDDRLSGLVEARTIAATARRIMRQNVTWAIAYNALSLPLAACGLVPPWLAAIGMSASSLGVILNSLRIAWVAPRAPAPTAAPARSVQVPA